MEQEERVRKYFNDLSSDYQKAYECDKDDPLRTHIFNERKRIVLGLTGSGKGKLLDIGCGPGVMTRELLDRGFSIYNTDISQSMIEKTKRAISGHKDKDKAFFKVCDIEHLDFDNAYFDAVLCIGVIEYLKDYHKAIAVISRILKRGGIAIISVPNKWSLFHIVDNLLVGVAFRINPKAFNNYKSIRHHKIATKKFVPSKFAWELRKYGLSEISMKFHTYRLGVLRLFFPKFWIFLNDVLNKQMPFLIATFLANDCVIKFRKGKDV